MKPAHILVAEDDPNILMGLIDTLESEGYKATAAPDGEKALRLLRSEQFDLLLLDIMMPGKSGFDVCRELRSIDSDIPVIMLTAKGEEIDKVLGLQLGADDYMTKPFSVRELLARIEAVLRRSRRGAQGSTIQYHLPDQFIFGDAEIDALQYRALMDMKSWDLSARELELIRLFFAHPNEVLSRDRLLDEIWGIKYHGTTRTVDQHIAQLRKKVESNPSNPRYITTVHGVGYRYEPDQAL
jgi:DNA-binding response OmpR family regulator